MDNIEKIASVLMNDILKKESPLHLPYEKADFFPDKKVITEAFISLKDLLFVYTAKSMGKTFLQEQALFSAKLNTAATALQKQIKNTFCIFCKEQKDCLFCDNKAQKIMQEFLEELPALQQYALGDITAAYNGDPAAQDNYEVLLCYPGLKAVTFQRMAHFFYKKGVRLIPRLITEYAHSETGIDIHPGAKIGKNFFIDHGTGVVIGETTTIGNNVKIYQGVTLGAKSFPLDENGNPMKNIKRHPDVGDDVTIYAGATILGPVKIGKGTVVAANTWITEDVPEGAYCNEPAANKKRAHCSVKKPKAA